MPSAAKKEARIAAVWEATFTRAHFRDAIRAQIGKAWMNLWAI
jgi:hypothetical protein